MRFENPYFLLFLIVPIVYLFFKYFRKEKNIQLNSTILFSSVGLFSKKSTFLSRFYNLICDILICLSFLFLIFALARPLGGQAINNEKFYGIDIILAIDVSGSMLNVDRVPKDTPYRDVFGGRVFQDTSGRLALMNRLNSAKRVINSYVEKQTFNRIGIVLFAGFSYTKCPLTLDKTMLSKIIDDIKFNPENDGTAIGMGIATAVNRLKKSESKSKVIILLTDGINNSGMIAPISAADIANNLDIRIYTIGLGNPQGFIAPTSLEQKEYILQQGQEGIDEAILQKIAEKTGGKFYRAYDPVSLEKIYDDIDKLEKSKIEVKKRVLYKENFMPFLLIGFLFLAIYIIFSNVVIKIP